MSRPTTQPRAAAARQAARMALLLCAPAHAGSAAGCGPTDGLRLNHAQVLATHNSYHVAPPSPALSPLWEYTHPPLDTQLERGVRSFELDVHYDVANQVPRVMHIPGSDDASTCETLLDCLQLAAGWSGNNPGHFPLHFYVDVIGGVETGEQSTSGCMYSDAQPAVTCAKANCAGSPMQNLVSCITSSCLGQVISLVSANSQCSSLSSCLGVQISSYDTGYIATEEDIEAAVQECSSKVGTYQVALDGAGRSAALAAVRSALDASFPAAKRVAPGDVQQDENGVFVWPEVGASRGKAMFFVNTQSSWGFGDSAGFYFGPGGAMVIVNDPSSIQADVVASGRWVRTRVDESLQIDPARQATALAKGAQVLATDFPTTATNWASIGADATTFWIPTGRPVGCNPVTAPQNCSAAELEDLSASCEEVEPIEQDPNATATATTTTADSQGGGGAAATSTTVTITTAGGGGGGTSTTVTSTTEEDVDDSLSLLNSAKRVSLGLAASCALLASAAGASA